MRSLRAFRVAAISGGFLRRTTAGYLGDGVLEPMEGMVYLEREVDGRLRRGLMVAVDLEKYDFSRTSQSFIRPTEGA